MSDALREAMKSKAASRRNPEFQEKQTELAHKLAYAQRMVADGTLTKGELKEFESHLAEAYIEAMPTEMFVEMRKDGSFADIETIARSHDGSRDSYDVRRDREALDKKIVKEALTEARFKGQIEGKRFLEEYRSLIGDPDEETAHRISDADDADDHDDVAVDLILRDLPQHEPEHEPGTTPRLPASITSPSAPADDNRIKDASEE